MKLHPGIYYDTFQIHSGRYKEFLKKFRGYAFAVPTALWRRGL